MRKMFTVDQTSTLDRNLISDAINYNELLKEEYIKLDKYYLGFHTILEREKPVALKNNKVVVNHAKYITDVNVGYLLGNPVEYQCQDYDIKPILDEFKRQTIAHVDTETARTASIYGKAYEYTYLVKEGEDTFIHTKTVEPRHCIVVYDDSFEHKKLYGIIYSSVEKIKNPRVIAGQQEDLRVKGLMVFDSINIYKYSEDISLIESTPHGFDEVPITEYLNNANTLGDFQPVLSLIDAYNLLQSDRINDKEQLVDAILLLKGFGLEKEQMEMLKKYRVLKAPASGSAEFLVKQLDETAMETLRKNVEMDIHKISMTPNLADEQFAGNSSGVAIRYKLIGFEQNVMNKERYFEKGLKERMRLYANYLAKNSKMQKVEMYDVETIFKRNLPQNDFETSQMILNLSGLVSKEKLVGQLSFIDNAEEEVKKASEEKQEEMNMYANDYSKGLNNSGNNNDSSNV